MSQEFTEEDRISWSTEKIQHLMQQLDDGYKPRSTPFYDGNPLWKKGNTVYDYTAFEIEEIKKCAADVKYFADRYCNVMTDEGVQKIKLRDYQRDMLDHFQANRYSVTMSSRQIGKCLSMTTKIKIKVTDISTLQFIGNKYYDTSLNVINIPLYELLYRIKKHLSRVTKIDKVKYCLYKIIERYE